MHSEAKLLCEFALHNSRACADDLDTVAHAFIACSNPFDRSVIVTYLPAQVSFAMNQIASDAATAGPRGKGRKRTRSENGTGEPAQQVF